MRWRLLAVATLFLAGLVLGAAASLAATDDRQAAIDTWRASLGQIENALQRTGITDADLDRHRAAAQAILTDSLALGEALKPLITAAEERLQSVAPREDLTVEESKAVTETRDRLQAELKTLVGLAQQADLVTLQARQIVEEIATLKGSRLATELTARDRSVFAPSLWVDIAAGTSALVAGTAAIAADWAALFAKSSDLTTVLLAVAALILVVAILVVRRLFLRWAMGARPAGELPTPGQRMLMAFAIVVADVGVPLLILLGLEAVLAELELLPEAARAVFDAVTAAVVVLAAITGLTRALLAPGRPAWRLVALADATTVRLYSLVVIAAFLMALLVLVERLAAVIDVPAGYSAAVGGVVAIPVAVLVLLAARALIRGRDALSEDQRARILRWRAITPAFALAAVVVMAASVLGFLNLARFLTEQIVWVWVVVGQIAIIGGLADQAIVSLFGERRPAGERLARNLGLSARAMSQVGVVASGLLHVVLAFVGLLMVAAPWGLDSTSVTAGFQGLLYGIEVGSLRITVSTVVVGLAVFVAGIGLSRLFQRWLDRRFLPTTRIDPGLKNSIHTAAGYLGVILAAIAAAAYAGLDLASVAIVAGALSVGIGFGLQSIVNNFVSGLILLVERPIRAGDWIAVGTEEGMVKKISVRATEIETFDRASVIIPNSTLISGMVKNRYLRDVSGRVTVAVGVGYGSDPAVVRQVLLDCAKAHRLVLSDPAPLVLFMDFGASALQFELRCYLADIGNGLAVQSDLRFAILERLRAAGIEIPFPHRDISIREWPAQAAPARIPPAPA
jgi:small-conductance mechanosensitive channel